MKRWIQLLLCLTIAVASPAMSEGKRVTLVVPYPTGGAADQMARAIAHEMREKHGYLMIVENRPGAGAQVAMNAVKNANPAAGTTLLLADNSAYSLNRFLYPHLSYDVERDLLPLTVAARAPVFLLVNKDSPIHSLDELVRLGQTKRLTYGSPGVGSGTHLVAEMLRKATGAQLEHVPYRGAGPALIDTVSGQIDFIFDVLTGSREYVESGRLRLVAAASKERSPLRPAVPTIAESGIADVNVAIWFGIAARAGTDPALAEQLARDLGSVLRDPAIVTKFAGFGIEMSPSTPAEFARLIAEDVQTYGPIIRSLNISLN